MRRVMVRYTVKPGRTEENERLVASVETEDGRNPLADVAAFARFQGRSPSAATSSRS
jgi:hypothetical protein